MSSTRQIDLSTSEIYSLQEMEYALFSLLVQRIATKHMIDVGAHHGSALEPFLQMGWTVDAFEPIKDNYQELARRFEGFSSLRIHPYALSSTSGMHEMHLALYPDGTLHSFYHSLERLREDAHHREGPTTQVETETIDNLVDKGLLPSQVGFLKIDTEGHDLQVLKGAGRLRADVTSVEFWCEQHALGKSPAPPEEMISLMKERGCGKFLVIFHEDDRESFSVSVFDPPRTSWGNILFFRDELTGLFDQCTRHCALLTVEQSTDKSIVSQVSRLVSADPTFIVIGASRGNFVDLMFSMYPDANGYLIGRSASETDELKERFPSRRNMRVLDKSFDDQADGRSASTHPPELNPHWIDRVFDGINLLNRLDLIKVDSGGNALRVLRGAEQTIRNFQPLIVTNVLFARFTEDQDSYYNLLTFFEDHLYRLTGIYNSQYTANGLLASAEMLFVPKRIALPLSLFMFKPLLRCLDGLYLLEEKKKLQAICNQRLHVIEGLHEAASERLELVVQLQKVAEERLDVIKSLAATAEERLQLILMLDAEVKKLKGAT